MITPTSRVLDRGPANRADTTSLNRRGQTVEESAQRIVSQYKGKAVRANLFSLQSPLLSYAEQVPSMIRDKTGNYIEAQVIFAERQLGLNGRQSTSNSPKPIVIRPEDDIALISVVQERIRLATQNRLRQFQLLESSELL
jgi:hypothetical protein